MPDVIEKSLGIYTDSNNVVYVINFLIYARNALSLIPSLLKDMKKVKHGPDFELSGKLFFVRDELDYNRTW